MYNDYKHVEHVPFDCCCVVGSWGTNRVNQMIIRGSADPCSLFRSPPASCLSPPNPFLILLPPTLFLYAFSAHQLQFENVRHKGSSSKRNEIERTERKTEKILSCFVITSFFLISLVSFLPKSILPLWLLSSCLWVSCLSSLPPCTSFLKSFAPIQN